MIKLIYAQIELRNMIVDFSVNKPIFLHAVGNPPAKDKESTITLHLTNAMGSIELLKYGPGIQTEYIFHVEHPLQLGFRQSNDGVLDEDWRNVVLAHEPQSEKRLR